MFGKYDKRVRVVSLEKNGGLAHSFSVGVEKAVGEYIILMDSDDYQANFYAFDALYHVAKETNVDYIKSEQAWLMTVCFIIWDNISLICRTQ